MITSVLGKKDFSKNFGKKGTSSDITLFNFKKGEEEMTFIEPSFYPDKIQSLFTAVEMSDCAILYVSKEIMNFQLGEIIQVLNFFERDQGILVFEDMVVEQIQDFIKGTVIEKYKTIENDPIKIKEELQNFKISRNSSGNTAVLDHSFQVKSVGNVFLGIVLSGVIKQYDKLKLFPSNKEIMVKSLQVHDVDVKEVSVGKRIGGSVKGCDLDDLSRGAVISNHDFLLRKEFEIDFAKNNFYSFDIPGTLMCFIGLQCVACSFSDNKVKFEKDVVYSEGQKVILYDSSRKVRIVGFGVIK